MFVCKCWCIGGRQYSRDALGVRRLPVPDDDHHAQHADRNDEQHLLAGQFDARRHLANRESAHGALVRAQDAADQTLAVPSL